ncbi:MAG: SRPBCC domain-containing protein [Chloroflexi bacterium]|nr:SRPBCC domain-containing protein [Chloroflexota bacterium]
MKIVRQSVTFKASRHDVYELLMDSQEHSKFTGARATIGRKVGDKFSCYDGDIEGVNLELVPDGKIVQSWRLSGWPKGVYSKATFRFAEVEGGTRLTFTQSGVPDEEYEGTTQGWRDYYWTPMKKLLARKGNG